MRTATDPTVRERRDRLGISQAALAALAGVTERTVSTVEAAKKPVRVSTLQKINLALSEGAAARREATQ